MALVKRSRTAAIVQPQESTPTQSQVVQVQIEKPSPPRVQLRRMSISINKAVEAKQKILEALKSISDSEQEIDRAQANIQVKTDQIDALMREHNFTIQTNGVKTAEIEESFTRQSRTIYPQKFRTKVSNEAFWASISVNITEAKKHLGEKELNAISDVVSPKSNGYVLKVRDFQKKDK